MTCFLNEEKREKKGKREGREREGGGKREGREREKGNLPTLGQK